MEPRCSMGRCATPLVAVEFHFFGGLGQPLSNATWEGTLWLEMVGKDELVLPVTGLAKGEARSIRIAYLHLRYCK